jgi:hypothetical protein
MRRPDTKKATNLLQAAKRDYEYTQTLKPTPQSAATIIRNTYESFRMLGEARLALAAIKSADHNTQLQELLRLNIQTNRPLRLIEELKRTRNNINYNGYQPSTQQATQAQEIANACFNACHQAIQKELQEHE